MAGRIAVSVLIAMTIGLRPLHFDALLLHDHGDEGTHIHAVTLASGESLERRHVGLHESEHHESGPLGATALSAQGGEHSEECSALIIKFGEKHVSANSARLTPDGGTLRLLNFESSPAFFVFTLPQSTASTLSARDITAPEALRALDVILSSSSALLI